MTVAGGRSPVAGMQAASHARIVPGARYRQRHAEIDGGDHQVLEQARFSRPQACHGTPTALEIPDDDAGKPEKVDQDQSQEMIIAEHGLTDSILAGGRAGREEGRPALRPYFLAG